MIATVAIDIAMQMGIRLTHWALLDGASVGAPCASVLYLASNGFLARVALQQSELEKFEKGRQDDQLETKIRSALIVLKAQLES